MPPGGVRRACARNDRKQINGAPAETIDLTIGPSVELHPVLRPTSAKSLAALIVADARVRKNAE